MQFKEGEQINANQEQLTSADLLRYSAVHILGLVTGHEVD